MDCTIIRIARLFCLTDGPLIMYTLFCPLRFIGWFGCRSSYFRRRHHRIPPPNFFFLIYLRKSYVSATIPRDFIIIPYRKFRYLKKNLYVKKDSSLALASGAKKSAPWHTYFFPISVVWGKKPAPVCGNTPCFPPILCCPPIMQSYGDILSEEKEGKLLSTF